MTEAPGMHDPTKLPSDIPAPQDDGGARHLAGMRLPDIALPATDGTSVNLSALKGRTVLYIYPRTGVPGVDLPPGWNEIPGARGCTPQSCGFRDHASELAALGAKVAGLSSQPLVDQIEFAERNRMPFPVISDPALRLRDALELPTFETSGLELYKRMAIVAEAGRIVKVFYPVFPPDRNAQEVLDWLGARR